MFIENNKFFLWLYNNNYCKKCSKKICNSLQKKINILKKNKKNFIKCNRIINELLFNSHDFNLYVYYLHREKFDYIPFKIEPINSSSVYFKEKEKDDGSLRKITAYNYHPKFLSLKILFILEILLPPIPDYFHGSIKGKGVGTALESLDSKLFTFFRFIYKSDITKFYPSVNLNILSSFLAVYLPSNIISVIIKLMTVSGESGLATGNPLSPRLCIFFLQMIFKEKSFKGLIYLDDLILVSYNPFSLYYSVSSLRLLLGSHDLTLHPVKSTYHVSFFGFVLPKFKYLGFSLLGNKWFRKGNLITTVGTLNKNMIHKIMASSNNSTTRTSTVTNNKLNFGCKHLKF